MFKHWYLWKDCYSIKPQASPTYMVFVYSFGYFINQPLAVIFLISVARLKKGYPILELSSLPKIVNNLHCIDQDDVKKKNQKKRIFLSGWQEHWIKTISAILILLSNSPTPLPTLISTRRSIFPAEQASRIKK